MFSFCHFDRTPQLTASFRGAITRRASNSSITRRIILLGAKIIDSFLDGTLLKKSSDYNRWIGLFEHDLRSRVQNLNHDEDQIRLVDTLEVRHFLAINFNTVFM